MGEFTYLSCPGLASASSIDIEAPCETVWEVISDLDALPSILTAIISVEKTDGPDFGVGTRWHEVRSYKDGEEISFNRIITGLSQDEDEDSPYRYKLQMSFIKNNITYTNTLMLESLDDNRSCRLVCTFAFASESCLGKVFYTWCGRFLFRQKIQRGMDTDLAEFADAAMKLQRKKQSKVEQTQ